MSTQLTQDDRIAAAALEDDDDGPDPIPEPPASPEIVIESPAEGARVVGSIPGVTVHLSGSGWTPFGSSPLVEVRIGASDTFHEAQVTTGRRGAYFWSYTGVTVSGGPITVTARVTINDLEELIGTDTVQLAVNDVPPVLIVDRPLDDELFTGTEDGTVITVSGSASSIFGFGPNALTWNRDNGQATGTTSIVNNTWITQIPVPADSHTLRFTCTDLLGNATSITRDVTVTVPTAILDVSLISYLDALIEFATDPFNGPRSRITTGATSNLTVTDLVQKFHQKFDQLATFAGKANEPLHQIRLCIEVLRSYLASIPFNPARAAALALEETRYRQAAYFGLLNQLGTSFDELRTARTAPDEQRESLANRLGISLGPTRPDNLDALFLDPTAPVTQPNALTEQKLEVLFGLVNTTRDPLQPDLTAAFLGWQLEHLLHQWRKRDFPLVPIENALPIIDPDLLIKGDFKNAVLSDPAYALFKARQDDVQEWLTELESKRESTTSLAAFNAMLMSVLAKQSTELIAMDDDLQQGEDISVALRTMKLDLPEFKYLVGVGRLLNGSGSVTLLESEWSDVCNILVQVKKKQKFEDWREEEQAANPNLSLSPNYFQSPAAMPFIRSTGTDAGGSLLPEGALDPNWTIIKPGATEAIQAIVTQAIAAPIWLANRNSSRWINAQLTAGDGDVPGNYIYRTSFDLTGFDPATVQLRMQIAVDNVLVDVKLNNQSLGLTIPMGVEAFRTFTGFQISSGFISGINTLEFIVFNENVGNNPTGLQAQLEFASVPQRLPLPRWRATPQARHEWEATLKGRIEQEKSVIDAFNTVIDQVEEAALPLLRNALVAATGKDGDWLTQRLLIDVKADSRTQTTRLNQAIETVQSLFFGLRNSDPPVELSDWELNRNSAPETNSEFDEQWNSIGSYAGWRAAMFVFLYPENLLTPSLRPANQHTAAFQAFLEDVREATPLTRDAAATIVADYLAALPAAGSGFPPNILPAGFTMTEQLSESALINWSNQIAGVWTNTSAANRRYLTEVLFDVPITLALHLQQAGDYETALAWYRIVYALDLAPERRRIYPGLNDEKTIGNNYNQTSQWLLDDSLNPHQFARQRADAYTRFTLLSIVRCLLSFADSEFTTDSFESLPRARSLYINAREVLDMPELSQPPPDPRVKMNPVIAALRARAEVNLFKLRTERNIAGMQRQAPALNVPAGSLALSNGNGGATSAGNAGAGLLAPTQYRYATVIERAKQLVTLAQQIEASFLASLEKRDVEAYNILKARQDLDLSSAHITLQDLRVTEAADSVLLAELQQDKSQFHVKHYQDLIQNDLSGFEKASMACLWTQLGLQTVAATGYTIAAGGQGVLSFLTFGLLAPDAFSKGAMAAEAIGSAVGMQAGIFDKMAGYERRKQEWQFQHGSAMRDKLISDQQHRIAMDQQQIVIQEKAIANTQQQHAQATVNFLATKFTNVELYEYMSGILQEVYSFFLQQATAMARLAQNQLAFERQEQTLSFIQADYWQTPSNGTGDQSTPDRRGMTGSARLLQDIYELDQHAFATNQRKLQLTKTISLAQMAPFEFQRFRETGVLPVAVSRQLFDQDFPGHYLRLIRRVRTSVIALLPPTQGIKATLSNTGVSRATIGGSAFVDVVVRRDPQSVALTSPVNATGLFELDTQPELLLPFEGLGVDTSWEFQMPKAANFIDYDTIADVLLTFEYTALSDAVYRDQVIQRMDRNFTADRAFSFREHFADQWYDLHNALQLAPARRFRVEFSTAHTDFPLNLERDSLKISNLLVYFVPEDGGEVKVTTAGLRFVPQGAASSAPPLGGNAGSDRGLLSTRSGSASSWQNCVGVAPFGKWTLDLSQDSGLQTLLAGDKVRDILFVVSYNGRTPAWPS